MQMFSEKSMRMKFNQVPNVYIHDTLNTAFALYVYDEENILKMRSKIDTLNDIQKEGR